MNKDTIKNLSPSAARYVLALLTGRGKEKNEVWADDEDIGRAGKGIGTGGYPCT